MPNNNHEQYNGVDICTYTDLITIGNTLTTAEVDACVLSAGVRPCDNPRFITTEDTPSQPAPNSASPFYLVGGDLWYTEEELLDASNTWFSYLHVVYAQKSQNALATQLEIDKYRNFVTITSHTETINGTPYTYYSFGVETKFGTENDWSTSVLKPMYVLSDGDARTGLFIEEQMTKQEYNFTKSWGTACTDLGYVQGKRNLKDNESSGIIEKAIWDAGLALQAYHVSGGTQYGVNLDHHLQWQNNPSTFYTASVINNIDDILMIVAIAGLKFEYNGTTYKPIVENGVVVGYTDDMTETSEWDEWEDIGDHTIPDTPIPPTPPSEDDDYADMGIGTGGNVGGLTSYAIMSISDLADLIADFNTGLQAGQSVVNNFVCCYKLGPLSSFLCTTGAHNIIMSAYSTTGNNFVSTRADYAVISSQKGHVLLGSYTVPRKTNTFYDFAPYSTYELFIPCCGWVPLPDTVAGRDIKVYLVFDLASCVCKGIVRSSGAADGTTIAEISGVIGSSVPFYVNDSGLARASLITGVTQTLSNAAMGAVGAASGNAGLAVMGLSNAVQSAQQTSIAGNTNYTAVRGGNGDMSAYANGEYCTIKITHPVVDDVVETAMFGHSVGYLCEEVGSLSSFHGFTVCANPHVHINATSAERDEITQLLEQGVILPAGE